MLSSSSRSTSPEGPVQGAGDQPQLLTTAVVIPWRRQGSHTSMKSGRMMKRSSCEWILMNPGETTLPVASITLPASASARFPTASIRSPFRPTSARKRSRPVPSTTVPPVIIVAKLIPDLLGDSRQSVKATLTARCWPLCRAVSKACCHWSRGNLWVTRGVRSTRPSACSRRVSSKSWSGSPCQSSSW